MTAYIAGQSKTSPVGQWATGTTQPDPDDEARLRIALRAADLLVCRYQPSTVSTWFAGSNPELGGVSPAQTLRDGDPDTLVPEFRYVAGDFLYAG